MDAERVFDWFLIIFEIGAFGVIGAMIVTLVINLDPVKRRLGMCWHFGCYKKVNRCRGSKECNGPMCDAHCAQADYHAYFAGCNTSDGVPIMEKDRARIDAL